eukprot:tig00021108_g18328.t1
MTAFVAPAPCLRLAQPTAVTPTTTPIERPGARVSARSISRASKCFFGSTESRFTARSRRFFFEGPRFQPVCEAESSAGVEAPESVVVDEEVQVPELKVEALEETRQRVTREHPEDPAAGRHGVPVFNKKPNRPRTIVLGTGWGGHALAKSLSERQEVVWISPRNYFLFTPMLPSTAVGTVDFRSIIEPIQSAQKKAVYYEAICTRVDTERKLAYCRPTTRAKGDPEQFAIEYDKLIIAVGSTPNTFGVPGVEEHSFFLKEITDATRIRENIMDCWETAALPTVSIEGSGRPVSIEEKKRLLTVAIVGGGPTGVEFCGEISDFIEKDLKRQFPLLAPYARIVLFQSGPALLPSFEPELQQRKPRPSPPPLLNNLLVAYERFTKAGIEVRLGSRVKEIREKSIVLTTEEVPFGLCVWGAGVSSNPLVETLRKEINRRALLGGAEGQPVKGRLQVDSHLRVMGLTDDDGVFAIGDCADVYGMNLFQTAQVAAQQGEYLAKVLNQLAAGRKREEVFAKPFKFFNLGQLTNLGDNYALAMLPVGWLKGYPSWLLWRSVYVTKQVSLRCRMLVLFDFFKCFVFGRDISRF